MLNINNKSWEKLRAQDIEKYLIEGEENYFFEYKCDEVSTGDLIKEISAFSNTYGGYIFLGIADDKTVTGCKNWTEQRITTTIHSCITPTPNFDIKKFKISNKVVFIIKIEEGDIPPYITNKGSVYERISSSSCKIVSEKITDAIKLHQLFEKTETQKSRTEKKLYLDPLLSDNKIPENLCAYIDFGFDIKNSQYTILQNSWFEYDFTAISNYLKNKHIDYGITKVGKSFVISLGTTNTQQNNVPIRPIAGLHNFIEIMIDGSVRGRILLISDNTKKVDIGSIIYGYNCFMDIYTLIFGEHFYKSFIRALKYEKLTVLKQFVPYYASFNYDKELCRFLFEHKNKYGNNIIISGNRIPSNDFLIIDKRYLESNNIKFTNKNLILQLFSTYYVNLGYLDLPKRTTG